MYNVSIPFEETRWKGTLAKFQYAPCVKDDEEKVIIVKKNRALHVGRGRCALLLLLKKGRSLQYI